MDRVSSANYQTISGRRTWQNKNLGSGIPGTTFDQLWMAGVQESIVGVIEGAGLIPADSALGSADTQLWEGVKRASGAHAGTVTASATLTVAQAGAVFVSAAGGSVALTLPPAAGITGVSLRFRIVRTDSSGNTLTLAPGGADTWLGGATTPIAIAAGGMLDVFSDGVSLWVPPAGSGSTGLISSMGTNGYVKTPRSDIALGSITEIEQWGVSTGPFGTSGAADQPGTITLAYTFPTACVEAEAWIYNPAQVGSYGQSLLAVAAWDRFTITYFIDGISSGSPRGIPGVAWRARGY